MLLRALRHTAQGRRAERQGDQSQGSEQGRETRGSDPCNLSDRPERERPVRPICDARGSLDPLRRPEGGGGEQLLETLRPRSRPTRRAAGNRNLLNVNRRRSIVRSLGPTCARVRKRGPCHDQREKRASDSGSYGVSQHCGLG